MNTIKRMRKTIAGLLAVFVLAVMGAGMSAVPVQAASGNVYTCVIHPCYAHPVTGVIEDSGGEASYATGQGMVEGAVYTTGIMELTDSGEYYLGAERGRLRVVQPGGRGDRKRYVQQRDD